VLDPLGPAELALLRRILVGHHQAHARRGLRRRRVDRAHPALADGRPDHEAVERLAGLLDLEGILGPAGDLGPAVDAVDRPADQPAAVLLDDLGPGREAQFLGHQRVSSRGPAAISRRARSILKSLWPWPLAGAISRSAASRPLARLARA